MRTTQTLGETRLIMELQASSENAEAIGAAADAAAAILERLKALWR